MSSCPCTEMRNRHQGIGMVQTGPLGFEMRCKQQLPQVEIIKKSQTSEINPKHNIHSSLVKFGTLAQWIEPCASAISDQRMGAYQSREWFAISHLANVPQRKIACFSLLMSSSEPAMIRRAVVSLVRLIQQTGTPVSTGFNKIFATKHVRLMQQANDVVSIYHTWIFPRNRIFCSCQFQMQR